MSDQLNYVLHLADNSLILGQRLGEWCGHGPVLEQDIALTNIALDLIGQSRLYFQYATTLDPLKRNEDELAFKRPELEYYNCLLVEQENRDFAHTIVRQYFFDVFHFLQNTFLAKGKDAQLAAIGEKSLKEIRYHLKYSSEWLLRLGDGTEESHNRMQAAIDNLWEYTGELFIPADYETALTGDGTAPDLKSLQPSWEEQVTAQIARGSLTVPEAGWMHRGGKTGHHTEAMGFILSDMQYMQRTYPGLEW